MRLEDIAELPQWACSYGGTDRIQLPNEKLVLLKVELKPIGISLEANAKDGLEQFSGILSLKPEFGNMKNSVSKWLKDQIGKTIDSIYRSEFSFEKSGE